MIQRFKTNLRLTFWDNNTKEKWNYSFAPTQLHNNTLFVLLMQEIPCDGLRSGCGCTRAISQWQLFISCGKMVYNSDTIFPQRPSAKETPATITFYSFHLANSRSQRGKSCVQLSPPTGHEAANQLFRPVLWLDSGIWSKAVCVCVCVCVQEKIEWICNIGSSKTSIMSSGRIK